MTDDEITLALARVTGRKPNAFEFHTLSFAHAQLLSYDMTRYWYTITSPFRGTRETWERPQWGVSFSDGVTDYTAQSVTLPKAFCLAWLKMNGVEV